MQKMRGRFSPLRALARTDPIKARKMILKYAKLVNGHKGKLAKRLNTNTTTLWRVVKELGDSLDAEIQQIAIDSILESAALG